LLNHLPVVGTICGLGLLIFALRRRSNDLKRAALGVLVISALTAIPTYLTGEPAEGPIKELIGNSKQFIEPHEEVAGIALGGILVLGAIALVGLVWFRGERLVPSWFAAAASIGSLVVAGLLGWTANLGGQIRHSEIRPSSSPKLKFNGPMTTTKECVNRNERPATASTDAISANRDQDLRQHANAIEFAGRFRN